MLGKRINNSQIEELLVNCIVFTANGTQKTDWQIITTNCAQPKKRLMVLPHTMDNGGYTANRHKKNAMKNTAMAQV